MQNASAPIPVVGVRPLVPERLPDSTTGRRDLAHALGRFMVANNIPISKGLRDDLSIGYKKAILYADEKIRKWENERAGNAPQTAQGGAQSTEAQADDRMLAQRGEHAQNGSKAVRGKSAQKQGNKKAADKGEFVLADGYETESGRPLTEADPKEFIIKPNGSRNFGEITKAISNAVMEQSGVSLPIGEIRLRVGDELEGLIHAKEHTAEARSAGYDSVEDLIADVAENFNQIYMREPDNANGKPTYSLVKTGNKNAGVMNGVAPIYFELQSDGSGNYYIVVSAIPKGDKSLIRQTKKDHLIYSSPGLGAATVSGNSAVSHDDKAGAANRGGSPTSDKSGDLDTSTISPEETESKENPLHEDEQAALKGLSADAKDVYRLVRDKLAGSSNKKVASAASVGAVLLARHADIIARKIRTALGKPFTAMDYYRNMFALKTEGDKTGANALHQAANAGGKMYAQSAHAIPLDDGQGKVVDIQFVDVDEKRALQSPHIGIRFSDEEYKIGDDVENSHNWVDGDWTDEELDGTSTVNVAEPWSYDSLDELKETAIKRLNKAGRYPYDYAYLVAGTSSDYGEDTNESIIRNAEVVGILKLVRESEAESFNQQMNEVIKGTTQDIPNGQRIISLFEAADESTFLHEMGHLFLLDLEHLAPMSPTAEKDLAMVKKWAEWREGLAAEYKGAPFAHSFADLDKKIRAALSAGNDRRADNLKRQWEHERFARGFEMYLKTGDAPTKGLRAVFAKFRAFLQRVYQAFTGTGGKATPEVEEVMARMISIEDSSDLSAYPRGKETEVYTDSGKSIPVQYRVVSADDLIASHDASTLEINPGYPSALQPRDRERVVMRQQVERMSNTLRPEELGEGRNLNQGAPLIRSDGVVLNGNGRTIAIARAQARNKERAAAYRDYLMDNAETFGLSREAVERVDKPVLVREVQGDISADTMNDIIGSTTGGSRMGASENAQADADKLTHTVMDTYVPNEKGDLTTAANRDFVAGILHKVVGQGELNAYLDKDGHVNADGIQRVKRALFAAAYGDDEIVAKMAESTDDDTRNVSNGLMAAAPMMARLSVKKDVPYMRELRDAIADAVKQLDTLRRSGDSVKDYLGAQALFSEHEDSAEMREILSFLDENKRSGKRIGNYFTHIAESLDGMENPTDSDLFETQLPSLMDVLEEAKTHAETGGQDGLFGDNAQEVTDKNTQSEHLPDVQSPKRNVQNDPADMAQEEAEGKQEPTLGLFFQTEPALEKAALEYGAKSENGKVTFTDTAQEKEFLQVAKALLSAGARKFSKAWHGTPHDYDIPSLDAIGTGEGTQAHGWGLYYAKNREVAEHYREWLSQKGTITYGGELKQHLSPELQEAVSLFQRLRLINSTDSNEELVKKHIASRRRFLEHNETLNYYKELLDSVRSDPMKGMSRLDRYDIDALGLPKGQKLSPREVISALEEKLEQFKQSENEAKKELELLENLNPSKININTSGGRLYHVEIPDADILLDEQKPIKTQPAKVRDGIRSVLREVTGQNISLTKGPVAEYTGGTLVNYLGRMLKHQGSNTPRKDVSLLLNKHGINGITYEGRRDGRCYVIFDDKAIKILEKFSARRQEELKKMLDGITLVSPNRLSPRKRALRDWGHEMGVPVVFFKGDPSLHGFHSDGVIFLNVDSEITPRWTFWHEAMHWMKANNPDLYNDIVHEISGAEGFTKEQLDAYRKEIGAEHMSDADVIEEMIADALPDVRRRVPLLRDVGKRDTGIVERLVAWVHDVMRRFHDHFFTPKGGLTNDQRRAMVRAFGNLVGSIRDADGKQIFRVANDGARITLRDGKPLPAVKYSQTDKSMKWIAEHPFTYDDSQSMDENIARAERLSKEYIDTFGTTDQINTPARQKLRREIADKLYGDGAAKKEGRVWLVLGVPASGKSTFSDPLVEREGALLIDSDEAKKMLPEFSNGLLAGAVHEESAKIADDVLARATANRDNMVLPLVGKTLSSLQKRIETLNDVGYEVNLIYVDLPIEKAIERTKARFRHTGRLVSPDYLRKVGLKPKENYDRLKVTEGVDSYEAWDSDVARGSTPRNIERAARPKQKASASGLGGRGQHARPLGESGAVRSHSEESRRPSLNDENRSDNQDGFSMPKFSARTNGESRVGNFRRMMDALKSGVKPSPRVEVHDGRREVTADIGVSQVKRFMKDKRLTDDEVISRRELPNGKVRITYYARSAMDIGYADQAKSVRQVAKRNPFVKALYDLASKAMHKQEKLRNDFAKSLKEFAELVKNPADMEKVTEILWTGDATNKEYTSAELRAAGASDNVVHAYALVRRELKKAYELLNEARMQVKTRSKVLRPEDVESYMQSHWIRPSDVLSKTQTQDGNIELTWRGGKTYETKNKLMSAEELSLMEKDENINVTRAVPANAKAYGAGMYHVGYVERIKPINNLTGYMPHFFHEWMIYEQYKDPVSKEIRYTSVGSGRTLNEAVKIGNTIAEKNKDRNYVVRPKGFDMDAGNAVVVGDMEFAQMAKKLTESTQMSLSDARTFLRESAGATLKSRHRFFGNMMKRKGAEGFDKNIMWVLTHYFNSSARYIAMEEFKPSAISFYERCFGAFDSEPKNMTARYCKDLINDVNGNPRGVEVWLNDLIKGTWLGKRIADSYGDRAALAVNGELSTWNAITKLGLFNFASAAVNFSQFINVGAALNDYGYAAKGLLRALHPSALDEKIIEASGLLEDINLAADNGGYSQRRGGRAGTVYQKAKQFGEWTLTL